MHLLLPAYPSAIEAAEKKSIEVELEDFMGVGLMRLISARTPDTHFWLVDYPTLFRRPGGPYQDREGQDWPDNARRFAVFNHVSSVASTTVSRSPPVFHPPSAATPGRGLPSSHSRKAPPADET
jgi:glycogen synthase